jgi:hypothetical protein
LCGWVEREVKLGGGGVSTPLLLCPQERTSAGLLDAAGLFQGITLPHRHHLSVRGVRGFYLITLTIWSTLLGLPQSAIPALPLLGGRQLFVREFLICG